MICTSIVSHKHGDMVTRLVEQLINCDQVSQIIVTLNIPENLKLPESSRLTVVRNQEPKGFGENHNAAFLFCEADFFCPLNPDIELIDNPFIPLIESIENRRASLAAPLIVSRNGTIEDSIRRFPTILSIARKAAGFDNGRHLIPDTGLMFYPDWVAGMFMLFRSLDYAAVGGFDENFFLYYEDVDICSRLWASGRRVVACPTVRVIHNAQRDSHRKFMFFRWHLKSMARYFWKHLGRLPAPPPID